MMNRCKYGTNAITAGLLLMVSVSGLGHGLGSSSIAYRGAGFVAQSDPNNSGKIYFTGNDRVACLDGLTGNVVWSETAPGLRSTGVGAGPVASGGTLAYMAGGGFFAAYGLDLGNGRLKWKIEKRSPVIASGPGQIYLATQSGLGIIAIDAKSGKVKWEKRSEKFGGTLKHIFYSDGLLYADTSQVRDAKTGRLVHRLPFSPDAITATDGRVFISGESLPLVAINAKTGKILWRVHNPLPVGSESAYSIYLSASRRYVVAAFYADAGFEEHQGVMRVYESQSGDLLWERKIATNSSLGFATVNVHNGVAYLMQSHAGEGTSLWAFDAKTGKRLWAFDSPAKLIGPPVSANGEVLFVGVDGKKFDADRTLYAVDNGNGALRWKFAFNR